jgi:hypothetical protein
MFIEGNVRRPIIGIDAAGQPDHGRYHEAESP